MTLMAHDDDADGFLGITYISHGVDHHASSDGESAEAAHEQKAAEDQDKDKQEKPKHAAKHHSAEDKELLELKHEMEALETQLQAYEVETEERLKHLERLSGHPISAEEKVFRIQEES